MAILLPLTLIFSACGDSAKTDNVQNKGAGNTSSGNSTNGDSNNSANLDNGNTSNSNGANTNQTGTNNNGSSNNGSSNNGGLSGITEVPQIQTKKIDAEPTAAYKLIPQPKEGDEFSYRITQKNSTEMMGIKGFEDKVYCFSLKVTGVNKDGSFTMDMVYDSIRASQAMPPNKMDSVGKKIYYNSNDKSTAKVSGADQFEALIGNKVILTLSNKGEVTEVANIDPILNAIIGKKKDSIKPQMLEQAKLALKVEGFSSVVQQLFMQSLPSDAVNTGKEWSRKDTSTGALGIPSIGTYQYKFTELHELNDRKAARVVVGLSTVFPQKKFSNKTMAATLDNANVSGEGESFIDTETGFPVSKRTKINSSLTMTGEGKTGESKGKKEQVSQKVTNATSVELLEVKRN